MTLSEACELIAYPGIAAGTAVEWADLGCGSGLFSEALLKLTPAGSSVYAVDNHPQDFTEPGIRFIKADFEKESLPLPPVHGIIMANSLHFIKNKLLLLQRLETYLRPEGVFILVEYERGTSNRWVPYPLPFAAAARLFAEAGFSVPEKIAERRSVYSRAKIYSAWSRINPGFSKKLNNLNF